MSTAMIGRRTRQRRAGDRGDADATAADDRDATCRGSPPPVLIAAPMPAITPQPSRPTAAARADGSTLVHWPAATRVFSANAPMPSAGDSSVPVLASVIFCVALWVLKQYCRSPRLHARHSPHTARQLRITKSPGATPVTSGPTASTTPAASWPSRNGKSSLMPPSR